MGERVIGTLLASGALSVMTVGGPDRGFSVQHVNDRYPGEGPLGGLLSAIVACPTDLMVVLACDLPDLTAATVRQLVAASARNIDCVAAVAVTDRMEPLCACYRVALVAPTAQLCFDQGIRSLTTFLNTVKILRVVLPDRGELRNVNTPDDHLT